MKDLSLLVWLTQFGLGVVAPLVGSVLVSLWLQSKFGLGQWIVWVGVIFGCFCAVDGLRSTLKILASLSKRKKEQEPPPVSFNDHD